MSFPTLDFPLGAVAWLAVVLLHAIIHLRIMPRRQHQSVDEFDGELLDTDESTLDFRSHYLQQTDSEYSLDIDDDDDDDDDYFLDQRKQQEDDPSQLIMLLDKTGSELIKECSSPQLLERRVAEQLRTH